MKLLFDPGDAIFQFRVLGDGHQLRQDGLERTQLDRFEVGTRGEPGNRLDGPVGAPEHRADGPIGGAAATRLDRGERVGLIGPSVGRGLGHSIGARPRGDGYALRKGEGKSGFPTLSRFSGHGNKVAGYHRVSVSPRPRFSAWGPGWPARPRRAKKRNVISRFEACCVVLTLDV